MRLAVHIHHAGGRVGTEAAGAALVRHAGERNALGEIHVVGDEVGHAIFETLRQVPQLAQQALVGFGVVGGVAEHDLATGRERHAVIGLGQVFGRRPPVDTVVGHVVERDANSRQLRGRSRSGQHLRL